MIRVPRRVGAAILAAVIGVGAIAAVVTANVYTRVTGELRERALDSLRYEAELLEENVGQVLVRAALRLRTITELASTARLVGSEPGDLLSVLISEVSLTRYAWIVYQDGRVDAPPVSRVLASGQERWAPYAPRQDGVLVDVGVLSQGGAFVGVPYRDDIGLSTLLPIIVKQNLDGEWYATGILIVDATGLMEESLGPRGRSPLRSDPSMEIAIYDHSGLLVETSRNLPVYGGSGDDSRPFEVVRITGRGGLVYEARVARDTVLAPVRPVYTAVLVLGVGGVGMILALGFVLHGTVVRLVRTENQRMSLRVRAVQAGMNPHFLFNTLDSLVGLTLDRDYDKLLSALRAMSHLLHRTARDPSSAASLAGELDGLRSYADLEAIRHRNQFELEIHADDATRATIVPRFCLQPLLENVIHHGLRHDGLTRIAVRVSATRRGVVVTVSDDGPGADSTRRDAVRAHLSNAEPPETGTGLWAVHQQLVLTYGRAYGVELPDVAEGFAVRCVLPAIRTR